MVYCIKKRDRFTSSLINFFNLNLIIKNLHFLNTLLHKLFFFLLLFNNIFSFFYGLFIFQLFLLRSENIDVNRLITNLILTLDLLRNFLFHNFNILTFFHFFLIEFTKYLSHRLYIFQIIKFNFFLRFLLSISIFWIMRDFQNLS